MFDINNFQDRDVWEMICEGRTKGVFQLESQLGRAWARRVRPKQMSELAALISLIRPGCLKAVTDGKSMTQHYCDRKSNKDPVVYPDDSLEDILSETYGVLVYQEQSMKIAQKLANFDLKEADALRKAIGKKKAGLMEEVKTKFLSGAEEVGLVTKEVAEEIFSWIEKSNRYAFNKSHAVSYAINAYWSAYCKYHKTVPFYVSYLNHSDRKPDSQKEIKELVVDAKLSDIEVYPPRLKHLHAEFTRDNDKIFFGMRHVKNVGRKECEKIEEICSHEDVSEYDWIRVLTNIIYKGKINKRAVIALISVGAFNGSNNPIDRERMLYEFDSWRDLTAREQEYIYNNRNSYPKNICLAEAVNDMINNMKINTRRLSTVVDIKQMLENPPHELKDSIPSIAKNEEKYLSCSLTCSKTDGFDMNFSSSLCKDIAKGTITGKVKLAVQVNSIRPYKTKRGKNPGQLMAFLCIEDGTGSLDSVTVFPEAYEKYKDLLVEENTILIDGEISKKEKTSVIVNKVSQI